MALPSSLHRFTIELSDVDRNVYDTLEFRLVRHPSETVQYALVRVLAYALEHGPTLEFGPGLCKGDEPALRETNDHGGVGLWLDVGAPSADRLHKASKLADRVVVYTHRDLDLLRKEWASRPIHAADEIRVVVVPERFLRALEPTFERNNHWSLTRTDGQVYVMIGGDTTFGVITETGVTDPGA